MDTLEKWYFSHNNPFIPFTELEHCLSNRKQRDRCIEDVVNLFLYTYQRVEMDQIAIIDESRFPDKVVEDFLKYINDGKRCEFKFTHKGIPRRITPSRSILRPLSVHSPSEDEAGI